MGCHFDTLAEPKSTDNYFFLVNGTSQKTAIQFLDFTPFKATEMGKTISRLASPIFSLPPTYPCEPSDFPAFGFVPGLHGMMGWVPEQPEQDLGSRFGVWSHAEREARVGVEA